MTRRVLLLDLERCVGCEACVVACLDQNDHDPQRKEQAWRQVIALEPGSAGGDDPTGGAHRARIAFASLACMHCERAPCLQACPTGAIGTDAVTGAVLVDASLCIGCHTCSMACPFGAPRHGPDGRMHKCDLCAARVEHGLEPACVHTCPTRALRFGAVEDRAGVVQAKAALRLLFPA